MRISLLLAMLLFYPVLARATTLDLDQGGQLIALFATDRLAFTFGGTDTATGVHYNAGGAVDATTFPDPFFTQLDGRSFVQYSATSLGADRLFVTDSVLALVQAGGSVVLSDFRDLAFFGSAPLPFVFPDASFTVTAPGFFSGIVTPPDFSQPDLRGTTYTFSAPTLTTLNILQRTDGHYILDSATAIITPEPSTWLLWATALVVLVALRVMSRQKG